MLTSWKSGYYNIDTKQVYIKDNKNGIPAGLQLFLENFCIEYYILRRQSHISYQNCHMLSIQSTYRTIMYS